MFNLIIFFALSVGLGEGNNLTTAGSHTSVYKNAASCEAAKKLEVANLEASEAVVLSADCVPQKVKKAKKH